MWIEARKFIFRGTNVLGVPVVAKIIARLEGEGKANIELYDETNRNVVAKWTDIVNKDWKIMATELVNLPENESVFLVRGETDVNYLYLAELMIEF